MTQQEITNGNKLIAEFMGGEKHWLNGGSVKFDDDTIWGYFNIGVNIESTFYGRKIALIKDIKYHSSWDWLMPVYYKFRDLKFKEVSAKHYHKQILSSFGNGILNSDITGAWNEAVMAINWYNSNK